MERRTFLKTTGAMSTVGIAGLAGCTGDDDNGEFPSENLTWMIPWSEGGGTDTYARQLAPLMEDPLGQSVQIDNRPGAGSLQGTEWLHGQDPDGYTFGTANTPGWDFTWRAQEVEGWDVEDFEPISYAGIFGYTLIVNNQHDISDFGELRDAYADDEISGFGFQGVGSDSHLGTLLLRENYDLAYDTAVAYDGGGPTAEAVISNEVAAGFATNTSAVAAEESGEATAVVNLMDVDITDTFPEIDSITNYGDSLGWITEFLQAQIAPPGTPEEERQLISDAVQVACESEESQQWMEDTGNIIEYGSMEETEERLTGTVDTIESEVDAAIGGFDEFLRIVEEES